MATTVADRQAKVVLIPVVSEGAEQAAQPIQAVFEASLAIEPFDEELRGEPFALGIDAMRFFWDEPPFANSEQAVGLILDREQFPIVFTGESILSLGPVRAAWKRYPELVFVQIAAHARACAESEGDPYGKLCLAPRLADYQMPVIQLGVRSLGRGELAWLEGEGRQHHRVFWARHFQAPADPASWDVADVVGAIPSGRPVYLSIDLAGLDGPASALVTLPEPGGLGWFPLLRLLRELFTNQRVVACDLTNFSTVGPPVANVAVARLLHKLVGYRFAGELFS